MLGVGLFLCVLALLVIGLLFSIAWDACGYDERIIALETAVKEQAAEIRTLQDKRDEPFAESYLKSEATS
jgi:Tfp pilus assembly protein PilN